MHIVGLLGMPRRVYTYPGGVGWTSYNVIESIGGYLTGVGILVLFANLVVSYFRGAPSGPDPWHGPTLEWTIPSPPPEYNFAVIPKVSSAYANWDYADREEDRRKLAEGVTVLEEGHQQSVSSPIDGWWAEIVEMPHDSPWPIVLALAISICFVLLLLHLWLGFCIALGGIVLALLGWHGEEPQESEA